MSGALAACCSKKSCRCCARRAYPVDPAEERVRRGIHISINGLAAGLRNTG